MITIPAPGLAMAQQNNYRGRCESDSNHAQGWQLFTTQSAVATESVPVNNSPA